MTGRDPGDISENGLLGGRIRLLQPVHGYRTAIDPVLLAAWADPAASSLVLDLGCGTGAAALCLAHRRPDIMVTGLDREAASLDLAARSAALNDMQARVTFEHRAIEDGLPADQYDAVITNPPYVAAGQGTAPPHGGKAGAHVESAVPLAAWLAGALKTLKTKGRLFIVHRADRLDEILSVLHGRAGSVAVLPLHPKADKPASRILIAAIKGGRGPLSLLPGLILHEADGRFTTVAEQALRQGDGLPPPFAKRN